jgi:putative DNA primase/helicase
MSQSPDFENERAFTCVPPDLRAIVARVGDGDLYNGGRAALVPGPGHSRKDRSLSLKLSPDGSRVLWWSHAGDDPGDVWRHIGLDAPRDREPIRESPAKRAARIFAEKAETARKMAFCADLWGQTVEAVGTDVERYLRGRGITGPIPKALRFHPAAPTRYPSTDLPPAPTYPAMVAIVTAPDGKSAAGIHATFLAPGGAGKAALRSSRRMFGEFRGAVVQLGPMPADGGLGVAEGIETALAYRALTGVPTWAALSTSGLKTFTPPTRVKLLTIAADGDPAGVGAARSLAERACRRCDCVISAAPEGEDWADALKGRGHERG